MAVFNTRRSAVGSRKLNLAENLSNLNKSFRTGAVKGSPNIASPSRRISSNQGSDIQVKGFINASPGSLLGNVSGFKARSSALKSSLKAKTNPSHVRPGATQHKGKGITKGGSALKFFNKKR